MVTEGGWKPKRSLDVESRRAKAAKIATLVERRRTLAGADVLEIGTGGGIIASLLAERAGDAGTVWSVDVDDLRTVTHGYQFRLVEGVELPFDDDRFDVVVSNHTIEHVGGPDAQLVHLREIARVLRPGGVGYLASPTRWALVEPHFKVPLLSWLPPGARSGALRLSRRGAVYDISPRTRPELLRLVEQAGLRATDVTVDALRVTAEIEAGAASRAAAALPGGVLTAARGAVPTMVFVLEH
jgi:ubiquinone/menaquinone biosynthesis C-methylase UbiE